MVLIGSKQKRLPYFFIVAARELIILFGNMRVVADFYFKCFTLYGKVSINPPTLTHNSISVRKLTAWKGL